MEAKEFLEKKKRFCKYYDDCDECPLGEFITCNIDDLVFNGDNDKVDRIIKTVEEWEEPKPATIEYKPEYKSVTWAEQVDIVLNLMNDAINDLTKRVTDLENRLIRSVDDFR